MFVCLSLHLKSSSVFPRILSRCFPNAFVMIPTTVPAKTAAMIVPIPTLPRLCKTARQVTADTRTIVQSNPITQKNDCQMRKYYGLKNFQKNQHSTLDSANNRCYSTTRARGKGLREKPKNQRLHKIQQVILRTSQYASHKRQVSGITLTRPNIIIKKKER